MVSSFLLRELLPDLLEYEFLLPSGFLFQFRVRHHQFFPDRSDFGFLVLLGHVLGCHCADVEGAAVAFGWIVVFVLLSRGLHSEVRDEG